MESVIRATIVYFLLLILMRVSGRRTFAQLTVFDFILLLIIGEATQQALLENDTSITNCILVIVTLVTIDIALAALKRLSPGMASLIDGMPIILVNKGKLLPDRLKRTRVDREDILTAAREQHGLKSMAEIDYAVLEAGGKISIIPK